MLPEKIKSIIFSCTTIPQLETCEAWCEYLYSNYLVNMAECRDYIKQRKDQLAICGIKSMTPELVNSIHQMD